MTKRHTIDTGELDDFSFEHMIASASDGRGGRKKLVAFVHPAHGHLHFTVRRGEEVVLTSAALQPAIDAYNDLP